MPDEKQYPSNSLLPKSSLDQAKRHTEASEEKPERTIKGTAKIQEKSVGRKILESFTPNDIRKVIEYGIYDQIIPSLKVVMEKLLHYALYGTAGRSESDRDKHTDFTSFSRREATVDRSISQRSLGTDISFKDVEDASFVLNELRDRIRENGYVSVYTMYRLSKIDCDRTRTEYGWRNLDTAVIVKRGDGYYYLNMPRPEYLRK